MSVIPVIPQSIGEVLESRTSLMNNLLDLISDAASGEIIVMPLESIGSGSLGYYVIYQGTHYLLIHSLTQSLVYSLILLTHRLY